MIVELVVGVAGSGKTTYCKSKDAHMILHDDWVTEQYHDTEVQYDMSNIFYPNFNFSKIDKKLIGVLIQHSPAHNTLLRNYFKVKFSHYILDAALLGTGMEKNLFVIECPFLDENIEALKKLYLNKLVVTQVTASEETIKARLVARGWSDERIAMSHEYQLAELLKYQHLVDNVVSTENNVISIDMRGE
jgi:dephospho-CoA kinase